MRKLFMFGVSALLCAGMVSASTDPVSVSEHLSVPAASQGLQANGINIQGIKLQGIKLQGINIQGTKFQGINIQGINIQGNKFQGTKWQGVKFQGLRTRGHGEEAATPSRLGYAQGQVRVRLP